MTTADLLEALGTAEDAGKVEHIAEALARSGAAVRTADGRFFGLRERGLIVGTISINRRGYGFVKYPAGDVYVTARDTNGAMHRDVVGVRLNPGRSPQRGRSGEVVQILERANTEVVGRFEQRGRIGIVVPSDQRLKGDVIVPVQEDGAPRQGDIVVARLTAYPSKGRAAQGIIAEVLGRPDTPGIEVEIIIREHGLRTTFPADVLDEANALQLDAQAELAAGREDVRGWFTVTIDPVDAKDFDDAITLERRKGGWRLGVHIADVSHYVPWDSEIDLEARQRGTSVYLVDRVLPMLPEHLSNGLCSLKPNEDRLSFSVVMDLDRNGRVEDYRLFPSVMRSDRRLNYDEVDEWLESGAFPDEQMRLLLKELARVAEVLGKRRTSRGGLDFDTVEAKVELDEQGRPLGVRLRQRTVATNMIEEAMILANEVVASHMAREQAPMVFRIHEEPDPDALDEVAVILAEFDYPIKDVHGADPMTFQRIVSFAHDRPEKLLINSLLLRALQRARYVDYLDAHFGLASEAYTHFTSPIRRYPDLIVHRLLRAQLTGALDEEPTASAADDLGWLADHCSTTEREAEDAEDQSTHVKLVELMGEHIGEVFSGIITGVAPFGLFVQLENTAEGLVHVTALADDYYKLDAERFLLYGERSGHQYRLGQGVAVRIVGTNVSERRIEMEIA